MKDKECCTGYYKYRLFQKVETKCLIHIIFAKKFVSVFYFNMAAVRASCTIEVTWIKIMTNAFIVPQKQRWQLQMIHFSTLFLQNVLLKVLIKKITYVLFFINKYLVKIVNLIPCFIHYLCFFSIGNGS